MAWRSHREQDIEMPSECSRAARANGPQHASAAGSKPETVLFSKAVALDAKDVGHLHGGPIHLSVFR